MTWFLLFGGSPARSGIFLGFQFLSEFMMKLEVSLPIVHEDLYVDSGFARKFDSGHFLILRFCPSDVVALFWRGPRTI